MLHVDPLGKTVKVALEHAVPDEVKSGLLVGDGTCGDGRSMF